MSKELNKALDLLREIRPSIPKDVLELWCKDRDALLASHPAPVEQAGGDEHAAQWHECTCPKIGEKWNPAKHGKDCPVHQARAALAQPSPGQAEAERPDVVAVVRAQGFGRVCEADANTLYQHCSDGDELMTVAQHERILASRWERAMDLMGEHVARISEKLTAERDAALARVAELETALTPFAAVADAYDDSEDDDHEPYTDMGCDDRLRLTLSQHRAARTALSGAPSQAQHSVPEGYALIPVRETEAMHDAVMALLYKGVARTDTQKLLDAYIAAAPGKEGNDD